MTRKKGKSEEWRIYFWRSVSKLVLEFPYNKTRKLKSKTAEKYRSY